MREKIRVIQYQLAQDPKLQEAVMRIKPQKSFWGIGGIVLFFFVPELVTYLWQPELVEWTHLQTLTDPSSSQRWLFGELEAMFRAGVSWFNLLLGGVLLWWAWR